MQKTANTPPMTLNQIAAKHLGLDTLAAQNIDHLDFHELAVWKIRAALEAAFAAGLATRLPKTAVLK